MENKTNNHEFNEIIKNIDDRSQHMYDELCKKIQGCALQKDLNYFTTILEQKANTTDVNESL